MADEENGNDAPSLELPSLGFGRKRRKKAADEPVPAPADAAPPVPEPTVEPEPVNEPAVEPEPAPLAPEPARPDATVRTPEPVDEAPTATLPVEEPVAEPATRTEVVDAMVPPEPSASPLFVDEVSPAPRIDPAPAATATTPAATTTTAAMATATDDSPTEEPRRKAPRSLPAIGGLAAAVLTGLVIGLATVGLTFGSLKLCEAARGTSSCGGSGFFLLVAILVAMVLLGSLLLRMFGVSDPTSTSFLAVGLMAVLVLLFLVDVIFSRSMIIVVPLFAMATFALSYWVTTAFIEPAEH